MTSYPAWFIYETRICALPTTSTNKEKNAPKEYKRMVDFFVNNRLTLDSIKISVATTRQDWNLVYRGNYMYTVDQRSVSGYLLYRRRLELSILLANNHNLKGITWD